MNPVEIEAQFRKNEQFVSSLSLLIKGQGGILDQLNQQSQQIGSLLTTRATTPAAPVANLLLSGEIGHSWHTWLDASDPSPQADKNREAAWWYAHNKPNDPQYFTSVDVDTGADTVTIVDHGFTNGTPVDLLEETVGTLPAPLAIATTYFLIVVDADTLQFAANIGDADATPAVPIGLTTTGTALKTFTIQEILIETYTTATAGSTTNNTLKTIAHTTFNPRYSKWDSQNGQADLTGTTSIDALMPVNFVDATTSLARVSFIAAKLNSYIEIPEEALMGVGIWDNTSGQRIFLSGDVGFTATLVGSTGTTERRFRALLTSDRGYQILSPEVTIANALADGLLDSTNYIALSWGQQSGQLQVDLYEHYDPGGPDDEYRLLTEVSAATGYIYEGGYLRTVSGYPTATGDVRTATFFTATGGLKGMAINAVSSSWDTINFPIAVPNNYNKANTTNRQWVRIWMTVAANLFITGVTTDGSATITIPDGAVDSAAFASGGYGTGGVGSSLYAGLVCEVYDSDDVLLDTTTIDSVTSDTVLVLADTIVAGSDRKIRIVAGGFHGVLLDKIHLGYQQNTSYAPNANDIRTLQPLAAPTSSDQGGVGGGGSGGGIDNCVAKGTPIKLQSGEWVAIENRKPGEKWSDGSLSGNILTKLRPGREFIRRVRTANGVVIYCTDGESFMIGDGDYDVRFLSQLRVGDSVVTEIDGIFEMSELVEISPNLYREYVYTPSLSNSHLFIAGQIEVTRWKRFVNWVLGRKPRTGGFCCHNLKPYDPNSPQV